MTDLLGTVCAVAVLAGLLWLALWCVMGSLAATDWEMDEEDER